MRALLPEPADDVEVHAFYAVDWIETGGLRVNFVASVDGAAQADGRSEGLQTRGDNRVFAALRDLADVVLAGAGTVTIEGYRAIHLSDRRRAIRRHYGLDPVLPTAVLSRSLRFDPDSALFTDVEPGARTIVLTCASAPQDRRHALAKVADVLECGDTEVDPALARAALQERGLIRILSEGGPVAFGSLLAGGAVDELCLSITPMLVGPGPTRIVGSGAEWDETGRLELTGLLEEDGALFLRYRIPGTISSKS
jgi:riboflavin biosynthesis pyrimidine reductase